MIMADVLTWFLIILGLLLVFVANWVGAYGLFPGLVETCSQRYARRPVAATFLGMVVLVPLLVSAGVLAQKGHPVLNLLLLLALTAPVLLALLGSAGLALRVGAGLNSSSDVAQPWRRALRGGVVLSLVFLMPVIGWFVLLPWTLVSGLGVALMALRAERAMRPSPAPLRETPVSTAVSSSTVVTSISEPTA
jgi:hypothetical protein